MNSEASVAQADTPTPASRTGWSTFLLALQVVLIALNLRPALVAVSPLVATIRADLAMSAVAVGLLTALPLLCFGLLSPVAPRIGRRLGIERSLLGTMTLVCAGTVLRSADTAIALFAGTVVIGMGIAVANVLLPALIKRDFPDKSELMAGLYSMSLFGGAALAAGITLPMQQAADMNWRAAQGCWGLPALLAALAWLPLLRSHPQIGIDRATQADHPVRGLWRSALAWQVTTYMGLQALNYYAVAAWLPTILNDAGLSAGRAGWMLAFSSLVGIAGSFLAPAVVGRRIGSGTLSALSAALSAVGLAGLTGPTEGTYFFMTLLGLGQGSALGLALLFIVQRAPTPGHAAQLSSMAQCFGFILASTGPALLGALHDASGRWNEPLAGLIILLVPQAAAGFGAARNRHVTSAIGP